ncbi:MAG: phosphoglucosamine mutase [Pirellulaceae bacterium]
MPEPIISVSGLRGIVGVSLTPELAGRFAAAFAMGLSDGPVVLTRDGRTTGSMLSDAVRATLCAVGRNVVDAGIAATPTTGVLVRTLGAVGGIQISASHNPPAYNGMKLFNAAGQVIPAREGQQVIDRYRAHQPVWVPFDRIGHVTSCSDTLTAHLDAVLATVPVDAIRRQRFRVLVDSNHGAGSLLATQLLSRLGCEVQLQGGTPDGQFAHPPEPTADNLQGVCQQVTACRAHIGFCQDPDADRLAVIDERGRYIGEEFTLALCLDRVLRHQPGPIVTNCSTSRMSEDLARHYGVPFHRSPVGEANVVAEMQRQGAVFGGEGNGGPIDPRVGYVRDSFVGMAQILAAMTERQMSVSRLADALPRYTIHKDKTTLAADRVPTALEALERHFHEAEASRMDGLRLDWPNRWLLVRASNTEPIVRIIAEAPDEESARSLCSDAAAVLQQATRQT